MKHFTITVTYEIDDETYQGGIQMGLDAGMPEVMALAENDHGAIAGTLLSVIDSLEGAQDLIAVDGTPYPLIGSKGKVVVTAVKEERP